MNRRAEVLLVVADGRSNDALAEELALDGYDARCAHPTALRAQSTPGDVELLILSSARPTTDLDVLRAVRAGELAPQVNPGVRVLSLAATGELAEVLRAFDAGADDVIRGAVEYAELAARVRALLRRTRVDTPAVIRYDALEIDTDAHRAKFGSIPLTLCRLEYALLAHLAQMPERVYTKQELLQDVWGFRSHGSTRTVDSHACRLRRKLQLAGAEGYVTSVWGVGYRLAPHADARPRLRVVSGGAA
jgi:DNA-binding response OmpR family regulator